MMLKFKDVATYNDAQKFELFTGYHPVVLVKVNDTTEIGVAECQSVGGFVFFKSFLNRDTERFMTGSTVAEAIEMALTMTVGDAINQNSVILHNEVGYAL